MEDVVLLGAPMPPAETARRRFLWRQVVVNGRLEVERLERVGSVHASPELRGASKASVVDGRVEGGGLAALTR